MDYYVAESIRQTQRVFPMQGRADFFRYDMNENIDGLPEDFVAEVLREVTPAFWPRIRSRTAFCANMPPS